MRILFAQFEASLKYHGHANWTQWISPETGKRSALYLGTNIGREHYTLQAMTNWPGNKYQGGLFMSWSTHCVMFPRLAVTLLPFLVTLVIILVSLCLLILCITQVIKRSRLKYDEVRTNNIQLKVLPYV